MPRGKGQRAGEPFDPLAATTTTPETYSMRQYIRGRRAYRLQHAHRMAKHLGLTEDGKMPDELIGRSMTAKQRDAYEDKLKAYPPMPKAEMERLVSLLYKYGLPLEDLPQEVASFIFRRVMVDYRHMALLHRKARKPLFTGAELVELMRVMRVNQKQLSEILTPEGIPNRPSRRYQVYVLIQRWVNGVHVPMHSNAFALRVNRLIETQVRKTKTGGLPPREEDMSSKPDTVRRRRDWRKQQRAQNVPISRAALAAEEDADATERPDEGS